RTRRVHGRRRRPRDQGRARPRRDRARILPIAAVALPGVADDRLLRTGARRRARRGQRGARRCALVLPRRAPEPARVLLSAGILARALHDPEVPGGVMGLRHSSHPARVVAVVAAVWTTSAEAYEEPPPLAMTTPSPGDATPPRPGSPF